MTDYTLLKKLKLSNFWHLLAVGFGSGFYRKAPGTAGSLLFVPVCMGFVLLDPMIQLISILVFFIIGQRACDEAEKAMGVHDHGSVVVDEFEGMLIASFAFPKWYLVILAFVLFRFFDIFKPWPISFVDKKVKGGFGIMLDDVIAGIFALLVAHVIFYFLGL